MPKIGYEQARQDFEHLETVGELGDAVEIDAEVFNLMRNPTKERARDMYVAAISLWFGERRGHAFGHTIGEIAARHNIEQSR